MAISSNWTPQNIAWAAGLWEGEGWINVSQNVIAIAMTDKDVINKFASIMGCGRINIRNSERSLGNKPQFHWSVSRGEHTQAIIAAFWPWLGERRRKKAKKWMHRFATAYLKRIKKGSKNGNSKLTEKQALEIFHADGTLASIGRQYGCTLQNVRSIKLKETWRCIHGDH